MKPNNPLGNFKYAAEGVLHVYRTQKHMRFHFFMLVLVLMLSLMFQVERGETLILLLTISLVLIAEMFNTAVEAVVDLVTQSYHP
ncbi:MAG: diacylglycerol kinase, partial [Armatimonadota bacterium]